ncbi:MAG: hypothetical protein LBC99_01830 [Spirochaetota bacterium]|jgi:hypothetical protein|nr:hypothetical protein [Spirochaetota bacterium]
MGQIPDPDYNPESSGLHYYYSREERLALPNAPSPMRPRKKIIKIIIIVDILLVVFIVWGTVWNKKHSSAGDAASTELEQGRYVFRLSRVINGDYLEAQLAIRLQSSDNFRLSNDCLVQFSFENGNTTNRMQSALLQREIELPVHVFSARVPYIQGGTAIRAHCSGVGVLAPVELCLE